jgi:hypothetical protein
MSVKHRSHFLPSSSSAKVADAAILNVVETTDHLWRLNGTDYPYADVQRMFRLCRVRMRLTVIVCWTSTLLIVFLTVVNIKFIFQVNLNYLSSPPPQPTTTYITTLRHFLNRILHGVYILRQMCFLHRATESATSSRCYEEGGVLTLLGVIQIW